MALILNTQETEINPHIFIYKEEIFFSRSDKSSALCVYH